AVLFKHNATTVIYNLSLHDALPISDGRIEWQSLCKRGVQRPHCSTGQWPFLSASRFKLNFNDNSLCETGIEHWPQFCQRSPKDRSEEHTSELQSRFDLVCRLLLEKK